MVLETSETQNTVSSTPQIIRKDPSLRASLRDGMAHSVMLGAGESYLNAFAIFLRGSALQIGLLASVPPLIGTWLQIVAISALEKVHSRKALLVHNALLQAALWIPIAAIPFILPQGFQVWALLLLVTAYFICANLAGPVWNSLIGDLVPADIRGSFFGFRNKYSGMCTFGALLIAGKILDLFERWDWAALGFLTIFVAAFTARLVSAKFLAQYEDPPFSIQESERFSFFQFVRRTPRSNFAKFVIFCSGMNLSAFIAGPYFALYMLRDLHFTYGEFTLITAVATLAQFLTMHLWGRLSDQFGNKKILTVSSIGVCIIPFFWLMTSSVSWILVIQTYAGFVWAGFNLAAANFMFDAVSPPKRARCVAFQGAINAAFVLIGSMIGSTIATYTPTSWPLQSAWNTPESIYLRVFFISGVMRIVVAVCGIPLFREVRDVEEISHRELIFRITHLRPLSGATFGLIAERFRRPRHDEDPS